jgi:outer membrane lipoprotein
VIVMKFTRLFRNAGLIAAFALPGCVSIPTPLQGQFSALDPDASAQRDATGESVRWGGTLARTDPLAGQTCFEIVSRPLNSITRPIANDRSQGRFIACRQGFYEPQVFAAGRMVTVVGHISGYETRPVGDYSYREPKVAADAIYLWPVQREVDVYYAPSLWFWGRW